MTISALGALYREEHARVLSSVHARIGDFVVAEECVQEAFAAAAEQWAAPPPNPRAWLIRVASNKAIDRWRQLKKLRELDEASLDEMEAQPMPRVDAQIRDERLRLVFTCCHPSLSPSAQVELTLRTVAGLTTEEIAHLFFIESKTMAQRLVRTQRKIRDARIPYAVPGPERWSERLAAVLAVVYLLFTEGYAATRGDALMRTELCDEAIRLGRLLVSLLPAEREVHALLALMLLHDARRGARIEEGELVVLEDQDRTKWDRATIAEALLLLEDALREGAHGPYAIQAAIAALHARAPRAKETDWPQILALYDMLLAIQPSAIVELNRAIAIAMVEGEEEGLKALHALRLLLADNHLYHAARGNLLARLGRRDHAARAYRDALRHASQAAERRFLERRLALCTRRDA